MIRFFSNQSGVVVVHEHGYCSYSCSFFLFIIINLLRPIAVVGFHVVNTVRK